VMLRKPAKSKVGNAACVRHSELPCLATAINTYLLLIKCCSTTSYKVLFLLLIKCCSTTTTTTTTTTYQYTVRKRKGVEFKAEETLSNNGKKLKERDSENIRKRERARRCV
jgi:hypothetical protein